MKSNIRRPSYYPDGEEKMNIITHGAGFIACLVAFAFLISRCLEYKNGWVWFSFSIYGISLLFLYLSSTLYHYSTDKRKRYKLNILDHCAIYVLIAGTYTPISLVNLIDHNGILLFISIWLLALIGIILEIFFTARFNKLSIILYLLMGWLIVFSYQSLLQSMPTRGVVLLISGGVSYTIGALFFLFEKIKFNHAVFHIFVLIGSLLHFLSIYYYVKPY